MRLKQHLEEIETWTIDNKQSFFIHISRAVPIAMRMIMERSELNESNKIKAMKSLSEFQHFIDQRASMMKSVVGMKFNLQEMGGYFAEKAREEESLIFDEIAFCIQDAYRIVKAKIKRTFEIKHSPSIYEFIESKEFLEDSDSHIGKASLNNLEGFLKGYFYAIDTNEISIYQTKYYPSLRDIPSLIKEYYEESDSNLNWKDILFNHEGDNSFAKFLSIYNSRIKELREKYKDEL